MNDLSTQPFLADLHFHTTLSDGNKTPEEVIALARERGIQLLANTDHDIVNTETPRLAREVGIKTCEGVEISATYCTSDKPIHLTSYAQKFKWDIHAALATMRYGRVEKVKRQIQLLRQNWFTIDEQSFFSYFIQLGFKPEGFSNAHLAEYIYLKEENVTHVQRLTGQKINVRGFSGECLRRGRKFSWIWWDVTVPRYELCSSEAIGLAQQNNAIVSLAHPGRNFSTQMEDLAEIVEKLVEQWMNGIELHGDANEEWTRAILKTKKRFDLILTFWSDSHFNSTKARIFGSRNPHIDDDLWRNMTHAFMDRMGI